MLDKQSDSKMTKLLDILSQNELFAVLRSKLKATDSVLLPKLAEEQRVQTLFKAIQPTTWKEACTKHFSVEANEVENKDPKEVYLQEYPKKRFGAAS